MKRKKILVIADGVAKTGFSVVATNLIQNLPKNLYSVDHLAINYRGDPHPYNWNIYPAMLGGDYMGYNRIKEFSTHEYDGIFILNDLWVIKDYLTLIKKHFKKVPPIIIYTPVDSMNLDLEWFADYDIVSKLVLYTEFGRNEVLQVKDGLNLSVVPHGIDSKLFYKLSEPKSATKKRVYQKEESGEYFVFLNANRNQPRKRIDLTMKGFTIFSQNKPINVKLHLHMGVKDAGLDILKYGFRLGIDSRLIVTNLNPSIQQITEKKLNDIYNAGDVGVNTCYTEGTKVLTKSGYKNIENIEKGEEVFSHIGKLSKVTNVFSYNYSDKILKITPHGAFPVQLTPNHKLFADMRPYSHLLREYKQDVIDHPNLRFIRADELLDGSVLTFPVIKDEKISIGEEKAFIYGAYLAEGSTNKSGIVFSLNSQKTDDYLRESITKFMKNIYNLDAHIYNMSRNRQNIQFCSVELKKEFEGLFNKGAHNKRIPEELLFLSRLDKISLLKAYFLGDGHLSQKSRTLTFTTVSESLAESVWFLLTTLGNVIPTLQHKSRGEWTIQVCGKSSTELSKLFNLKLRENNKQIRDKMWADDSYMYLPIRKIENIEYSGKIFDLEVDGEHSYLTHTAGHNSLGEGWGLTATEHAVTGAPQIVSDNSALHELYKDCGLLVPTFNVTNLDNLTEAGMVTPLGVAEAMEKIYSDKELYEDLSKKTLDKFAREEYTWKYIVQNRWEPIFSEVYQ